MAYAHCSGHEKYGKLNFIEPTKQRNSARQIIWKAICDCGNETHVSIAKARSGEVASCGCMRAAMSALANKARSIHGNASRNALTPTYKTWLAMRGRCNSINSSAYPQYGAVGIRVCDRWNNSFAAFLQDMGERPSGCTIDRIKNSLGYEPGNCRWATKEIQSRNRKSNVFITIENETHCLTDWAAKLGIKRETISTRIRRGWTPESAVITPVGGY